MKEKRIVYGLPLNPLSALEELAGKSFCISYAHRHSKMKGRALGDAIRLVGSDGVLVVDNGAFTAHRTGERMSEDYLERFEAWAAGILERCPSAIAVVPDVIGGTEEENAELVRLWWVDSDRSMAVWHLHESLDYLVYL